MFNLGDKPSGIASQRIKHIETGNIGIVIGFGKLVVKNKCLPTVKVKITNPESSKRITINGLNTQWLPCPEDYKVMYLNFSRQNLILKPIQRYDRIKSA